MNNLLLKLAKECRDITKPYGETDVLLYYGLVAPKLEEYLNKKMLASKVWLPNGKFPNFINRGSKLAPLYIEGMIEAITPEFLELRKGHHLEDVRSKLTKEQIKTWQYFVPRKMCDFFYATNGEGIGLPLDRIFFDIDRGNDISAENAQKVAELLVEIIKNDADFNKQVGYEQKIIPAWTGNSFHIYLHLKKQIPNAFYDRYIQYSKSKPLESFTGRWAAEINKSLDVKVAGGHEKIKNTLNIDPSQSPSGKLCRVLLSSLHMKDAKTIDGLSLPIESKMLKDKRLIEELKAYTPKKVIGELDILAKRIAL